MRARDHGIRLGRLEPGPGNAITDVPGVLVGHASHAPDNTGVTVIVPRAGRDAWLEPVYAGVAVLNGAGELTGSIQIREWGLMETPVFLTGTPYVGAVYDAATRVLGGAPAADRRRRRGDPRGRRERPELDRRRRARAGARPGAGGGRAGRRARRRPRRGSGRRRHRHDVLRLRRWHRHVLATGQRRLHGRRAAAGELRRLGGAADRRSPRRRAVTGARRGGVCISVVATDAPLLPHGLERLARRAFLGLARVGSYASNGSGEIGMAFSTANAEATHRDAPDVVRPELLQDGLATHACSRPAPRRPRRRC